MSSPPFEVHSWRKFDPAPNFQEEPERWTHFCGSTPTAVALAGFNFWPVQASNLRSTLENMKISKDALWVVSPLTRALETMVLACPHTARITATEHPPKVIVHK